jgi:hypothetical protein
MRWNFEAVEWNLLVVLTLVGGAAIAMADPVLAAEPAIASDDVAEATDLPPAIRAIQDSLGGPLADHFEAIQQGELPGTPWWKRFRQSRLALVAPASVETSVVDPRLRVSALRDAAAHLDDSANRLESLDLYHQADALREVAQRLRVDARRMAGEPGQEGIGPIPAWGTPVPAYGGTQMPSDPPRPSGIIAPAPLLMPSPTPTYTLPDDEDADSDARDDPGPDPTPARAD